MTQSEMIENDGIWTTIINWLDELYEGPFVIPFGSRPPITRNPDGSLNVHNRSGTEKVEVGEWILFNEEEGEFHRYERTEHIPNRDV